MCSETVSQTKLLSRMKRMLDKLLNKISNRYLSLIKRKKKKDFFFKNMSKMITPVAHTKLEEELQLQILLLCARSDTSQAGVL